MKHSGQKSVKEKLPKQRKGPKRAAKCRLKVPTHIWEQDAAGSNPVTRTSPSVHMGTRIFYLAKCRYEHPYQAEPGRNLRSGLGFFFCPFARAYSVQLSFHLDQRQAAAPQA